MFVPEMDGDFRIKSLMEFYNEQGFTLSYDLPDEYRNRVFDIGTSAPIPFWLSGKCHVITGDADKDEPQKLFGMEARRNPVLLDISRLLDDARSGRIKDRFDEWVSENIANGYADVFFETPVRSRYWVTRYRVAVAKARRLTNPPHPVDAKLRNVAVEWFNKYGRKTDLSKLGGMLGSASNQILSRRQITDILFAFLMNKLVWNDMQDIEAYLREHSLHKAFPGGLYHYYVQHGWPRVPFDYEQDADFASRMMDELSIGAEREKFERAAKIAFLFFGRSKAPEQVESLARTYLKQISDDFVRLRKEAQMVFKDRRAKDEWPEYADALLDYYDQLMDLDGIINPSERMKRVPFNHRFGVSVEYLKELRNIKRGN